MVLSEETFSELSLDDSEQLWLDPVLVTHVI